MRRLAADLHVHTVLSPCAARDMTPPSIVRGALAKGLAMIAVCDHNSAGNVEAVAAAARAAAASGAPLLAVVPGMEITTSEEVHVLGLFPDAASARAAAAEVMAGLPPWRAVSRGGAPSGMRSPEQEFVDAAGAVVAVEQKMLSAASTFDLSGTVDLIHRHGGLAVAAHMDRKSFSVPSQLGFLPPDVAFDALEISAAGVARGRAAAFAAHGLPLLTSSDSHFPDDIGVSSTTLEVAEASFAELALALAGRDGRRCALA